MGPENNVGFVLVGEEQVQAYALIMWRSALGLEIRSTSGMVASRHVNARTIIPELVRLNIVDVPVDRITKARKIKAYNELNKFMADNGFEDKPLDSPGSGK